MGKVGILGKYTEGQKRNRIYGKITRYIKKGTEREETECSVARMNGKGEKRLRNICCGTKAVILPCIWKRTEWEKLKQNLT